LPEPWRARIADARGRGVYAGYPNRNRCIFIHIPKTAGSSMASALFGAASRHVPYFEYQRANPAKFRKYFKFAFVRNPWDRLVSTYFFLRAGGLNAMDRAWAQNAIASFDTFDDFVASWLTAENVASWVHFLPQAHFVLNADGRVMVDFLGRFERLNDDFNAVARRLERHVELPSTNRGEHVPYADYYTPKTREIVARVYARDISAFGYGFEK
jgi:hypothetical protein